MVLKGLIVKATMSLYEISYRLPYVVKLDHALDIFKCMIILNFVKAVITMFPNIPFDIIEIIGKKIHKLNIGNKILERHSLNCGYTGIEDYLCYYKIIKLHISLLEDIYECTFNSAILQAAGFWNANSAEHMFIVNLKEKVKIINSHYYRGLSLRDSIASILFSNLKKNNIYNILYHTRKILHIEQFVNYYNKYSSTTKSIENELQKQNDILSKQPDKKNYEFLLSEKKFSEDMEAIYRDMNEYTKHKYVLYQCELTFLQKDDIKKVGKSTLHIVNGDSFSLKINLCLFDNGDYYFVKILEKDQEIICKTDFINSYEPKAPAICILINFIELHKSMNLPIPADINLKSHTSLFLAVNSEIMKQDKSIEENDKEFISIWSTGKLTTWKS